MNRRTKSDWQALFTEHDQSDLTAVAFCKAKSLNPKYFSLRKKQLQTAETDKKVSAFIPVIKSELNTTTLMELHQGDTCLKIPVSVSPEWLVNLIHQLQA